MHTKLDKPIQAYKRDPYALSQLIEARIIPAGEVIDVRNGTDKFGQRGPFYCLGPRWGMTPCFYLGKEYFLNEEEVSIIGSLAFRRPSGHRRSQGR